MPNLLWTSAIFVAQLITPLVAQSSLITSAASPSATSSALAQTHTISVGIDHKFKPEVTQAEAGDLIEFLFFPPNHSVVRAEYEFPCIPYEMTGRGKVGFFSGFRPVDAILADPPSWTLKVNDTNPIFFYCSAPGSCIRYGMVAVINPNANTSLEHQRQLAKDSAYMLNPGEPFPPEGTPSSLPSASASATSSTPASSSTTSTASATAVANTAKANSGLSKGAIAGIAVAGVAVLALAAALFFFIGRTKTLKQEVDRTSTSMHQHVVPKSFSPSYSRAMSDVSNEPSMGSPIPGGPPYEYLGHLGTISEPGERRDPKTEFYETTEEERYLRSPGPDSRYNTTNRESLNNTNATSLRRHPTVAINPYEPREMEATDPRHAG